MPSSVDNRIVQMTFDNAAFERKLSDTIASIDKLEKSLQFEKSQKSLQNFADTTNKLNFGDISAHIDGVSKKFLALSTIAVTALSQITSAALKSGEHIVKSLSLDQIISGFQEYEMNIGSIQTILANTASKGSNLKDVNAALDELNTYSDKTIYNFSQMTKNIGTFTAAGVDLKTSTQSIKGIANLAAISGSSADQASGAMYQLSQAIANGSLKLMDWNSVVNAGLGGEVFQKSLFETGKAMKTLKNVPMNETFDQWKKAGNSFRGSLESGWVTAKVLTQTLQGFTGELTDAQLKSVGYTKAQADEIKKLGVLGVDSATKVRTLTQLLSTVKEAIGSGWGTSFRTIFGDFEEATKLFTDVSNAIGKMVGQSANARNELLNKWKSLGGRIVLIQSLKEAFQNLGAIMKPIQEAFRTIFPPLTGKRLFELTKEFHNLVMAIKPSKQTVENLRVIFTGMFSALSIGLDIMKNVGRVIVALFQKFTQGTGIMDRAKEIAAFVTHLQNMLVVKGGIERFFDDIIKFINKPGPYLDKLKDKFFEVFNNIKDVILNPLPLLEILKNRILGFVDDISKLLGFSNIPKIQLPGAPELDGLLDRLKTRFDQLKGAADIFVNVWDALSSHFGAIKDALQTTFDYIVQWFKDLGKKLAAEMKPGDFNDAVDALNVGLLGGIVILLKKFLSGGLKIDFGDGLLKKISGAFDQLTGTLKAMQAQLKAEALEKIAIAIGILTASLVVLSLIDSVALTKALTAMAAGFGEMIAVMAAMNKLPSGPSGALSFATMAAGLIAISTAMLIFAGAMAVISTLSWEGIAKGLVGIAGGLGIMVAAIEILGKTSLTTPLAAAAMLEMSVALTILGGALKLFATMSWGDIAKGLTVLSVSLLAIGLALTLIPADAPLIGAGVLLVAMAMDVLAPAMLVFAHMSWGDIGKGLVAVAGALVAIGAALWLIPPWAVLGGAGLVAVAGGLAALGLVMKEWASIKWGDIGKGIGAMALSLITLGIAVAAMVVALPGAVALTVVVVALEGLVKVVEAFASLKFGDLLKGLGGMALVFGLLAAAAALMAPLIGPLIALGAAMIVIGAGFTLFGAGAILVAKSIEILAKVGKEGIDVIFAFIDGLVKKLPELVGAFAASLLDIGTTVLKGADPLVRALGVVIEHILDTLIKILPKLTIFLENVVADLIKLIYTKAPDLVAAGLYIIIQLMTGIKNNIQQITDLAGDIIANFLKGLADKIPDIVAAAVDVLVAFIKAVTDNELKLVTLGIEILGKLVNGIVQNIGLLIDAGANALINFVLGISNNVVKIANAAGDVIVAFINALADQINKVISAGADFVLKFMDGVESNAQLIEVVAVSLIEDFITNVGNNLYQLINLGGKIVLKIVDGIKNNVGKMADAGGDVIVKFIEGIGRNTNKVIDKGTDVIIAILKGISKNLARLTDAAGETILNFLNALDNAIVKYGPKIRNMGLKIAWDLIDGATFGLGGRAAKFFSGILGIFNDAKRAIEDEMGIKSPSTVFYKIGENMILGLVQAFEDNTSVQKTSANLSKGMVKSFQNVLSTIPGELGNITDFNPTITPVLDLSDVEKNSKKLAQFFVPPNLDPFYTQAQQLSTMTQQSAIDKVTVETQTASAGSVQFNQVNNSPKALSTADIYRQTRNQIALAKQELRIP